MNQKWIAVGLIALCTRLFAADIPSVVEGSDAYDAEMCIKEYTDICNSNVCMTSEDLDCGAKCEQMARDKCKEQSEE